MARINAVNLTQAKESYDTAVRMAENIQKEEDRLGDKKRQLAEQIFNMLHALFGEKLKSWMRRPDERNPDMKLEEEIKIFLEQRGLPLPAPASENPFSSMIADIWYPKREAIAESQSAKHARVVEMSRFGSMIVLALENPAAEEDFFRKSFRVIEELKKQKRRDNLPTLFRFKSKSSQGNPTVSPEVTTPDDISKTGVLINKYAYTLPIIEVKNRTSYLQWMQFELLSAEHDGFYEQMFQITLPSKEAMRDLRRAVDEIPDEPESVKLSSHDIQTLRACLRQLKDIVAAYNKIYSYESATVLIVRAEEEDDDRFRRLIFKELKPLEE